MPSALAEILFDYGIQDSEMRAYEALLRSGSATATKAAQQAKQSRGRIYDLLRSLVEKGLVREEPGQPVRFHAVPLHEVLARTISDMETHVKLLRQASDQLPSVQTAVSTEAQPVAATDFSLLRGGRAVAAETRRLARSANKFFYIGGGYRAHQVAAMAPLLSDLKVKVSQGVQVYLVLPNNQGSGPSLDAIIRGAGDVKVHETLPGVTPPIVYIANESVALFVFPDSEDSEPHHRDDVALRIAAPAAVKAAVQHLRNAYSAPQSSGPVSPRRSPTR